MTALNVHICAFGDLEMCQAAIESVPEDIPIHVFDGRFATFEGETDLTPGLETLCERLDGVFYHAPPAERLPFGSDVAVPESWRPDLHAKSMFVHRELPPDEWTIKLDTDERIERCQPDALDSLDADHKHVPRVEFADGGKRIYTARLWQPRFWTPWIGDCLVPRELFPRATHLQRLAAIWRDDAYQPVRFLKRDATGAIEISNHGHDRPEDYQLRRARQLDRIDRGPRARLIRDELERPCGACHEKNADDAADETDESGDSDHE